MKPYQVVTAQTVPELEARVCELMATGFMPLSSVCVSPDGNSRFLYAQAMVSVGALVASFAVIDKLAREAVVA